MTLPGGRRHGLQSAEFRRPAGLQFPITILEIRTWKSPRSACALLSRGQAALALVAAWTPSWSPFQDKSLKKRLGFPYV